MGIIKLFTANRFLLYNRIIRAKTKRYVATSRCYTFYTKKFRMEIEMLKLREDSCIERIRRLHTEVEEMIFGKCSGPASDYLIDFGNNKLKETRTFRIKDG